MAGTDLLSEAPREHCGGGCGGSGNPSVACGAIGSKRGTSVESEPSEPQQESAKHHERNIVRTERLGAEALALADDQHDHQSGDCSVDVHDRTTCEIVSRSADGLGDRAVSAQQTAIPHHVGERSVIEGNPQRDENHPSGVLDTFSDSAANQSDSNHGECGLERHIDADRVVIGVQRSRREDTAVRNHGILQQEARGRVTEDTADRSACVGDGPAPQHPDHHCDG